MAVKYLSIIFSILIFVGVLQAQDVVKDFAEPILTKSTPSFSEIEKERVLRILVPATKTYYFHDGGESRGVSYEAGRKLEGVLNRDRRKGHELHVVFIPATRLGMIAGLTAGIGDLAMGGLTINSERMKSVDFSNPTVDGVSEVIVTGPGVPELKSLEDLSGKKVWVRKFTSYYESLLELNQSLKKKGLKPVDIQFLNEWLEDEDVMELQNAGAIPITVIDSYLAELWAGVFSKVKVYSDLKVATNQKYGWAFRKNSPELEKVVNDFIKRHRRGTLYGNTLIKRYFKSGRWINNPLSSQARQRFEKASPYFKKYGAKYDFDWLMLAAKGYQESKLDQNARSRYGAIGVMQLTSSTGKAMKVGDITQLEANIHAGTKYLRLMVDKYYAEKGMSDLNRILFAIASYNAGPARISQLRKTARREGLNPNQWFNNVELIAGRQIGREPVRHVSSVYKYYMAYRLMNSVEVQKERAKKSL